MGLLRQGVNAEPAAACVELDGVGESADKAAMPAMRKRTVTATCGIIATSWQ
jgi:hypothetical protein